MRIRGLRLKVRCNTLLGVLTGFAVLLLLICIFLIYAVIDAGISRTYLQASVDLDGRQIEVMKRLLAEYVVGKDDDALYRELERVVDGADRTLILKRDGETILFESIEFRVQGGTVVGVD